MCWRAACLAAWRRGRGGSRRACGAPTEVDRDDGAGPGGLHAANLQGAGHEHRPRGGCENGQGASMGVVGSSPPEEIRWRDPCHNVYMTKCT